MAIPERSAQTLREYVSAVETATLNLHTAQLDLRMAINMTYLEEHPSMRELAEVTGLSHQRIAQIVAEHVEAGR